MMSADQECELCGGERHSVTEILEFSGVMRVWWCKACREDRANLGKRYYERVTAPRRLTSEDEDAILRLLGKDKGDEHERAY